MHLRNTIFSFKELNVSNKHNFVNNLLMAPELNAIYILSQQYSIDRENILAINTHIESLPPHYKNSKLLSALKEKINRMLNMPQLLTMDYANLSSADDQRQFIIGLLLTNHENRATILRQQKNLSKLFKDLREVTGTLQDFYCQFPTFASLLNQLAHITEELNPKPTIKPDLSEKEIELASSLKKIPELFVDRVFSKSEIVNPVITPQGTTYEKKDISQWILLSENDPLDRSALKQNDLIANSLFTKIKRIFDEPLPNLRELYQRLHCPLSGKLLEDPVVAADGKTYSRAWIDSYLADHKSLLPNERDKQIKPFYPNRFISNLMSQPEIKNMLAYYNDLNKKEMGSELCETVEHIDRYIDQRLAEPHYAGSRCGYTKWDKLSSAAQLNRLLHLKQTRHHFFAQTNLRPLNQGRIQPIFKRAMVEYDKQNRVKP